jgi:hypothetical protein
MTDPNGLYCMRARFYNPRLLRFVNADPIEFGGGTNWYAYCGNNPISRVDPLGLCSQSTAPNSGGTAQFASYNVSGQPQIGDQRLIQASAGYLGWQLGNAGQFQADQAALDNFFTSLDSPLSPLNFTDGIPNPFSQDLEDRLTAAQMLVSSAIGSSDPSMVNAANNLVSQAGLLLNQNGPWSGATVVQTETYTQQSALFGLITWNAWVPNAPVYTQINDGPPEAGGFYLTKLAAQQAAQQSLVKQLTQMGFLPPPTRM